MPLKIVQGDIPKKSKVKNMLIVLLVLVIVLMLLAIVFRNQISDFIWNVCVPIGPGGMIDPTLN